MIIQTDENTYWSATTNHVHCTPCVRLASQAQAMCRCTGSVESTAADGEHWAKVTRWHIPQDDQA